MTDLSPAAQAVYDGFWRGKGYYTADEFEACLAAALRAVADQVVSANAKALQASQNQAIQLSCKRRNGNAYCFGYDQQTLTKTSCFHP